MSILDDIRRSFSQGGMVIKLIYINVGLYLIQLLLTIVLSLFNIPESSVNALIGEWLWVPNNLKEFPYKFYTILTYSFLHAGFWHLLMNMLVLYWFGNISMTFIREKQVLPLYLLGGFSGALVYLVSYAVFPALWGINAGLVGASAAVMAFVFASATIAPNYEVRLFFLFTVPIKYIAFLFLIMDIFFLRDGNEGGHFAHIGGALVGFLFVKQWQSGRDITKGMSRFFDWVVALFQQKKRRSSVGSDQRNPFYSRKNKHYIPGPSQQEQVDAILDKIAQSGYESLSKSEKEFLFQYSNKTK